MPIRLTERRPEVGADRLLSECVPPPRFAPVRFGTFRPDPAEPSQAAALAALRDLAGELAGPRRKKSWWRRDSGPDDPAGIYLDGGFGVGKTHLLASLWHESSGPKMYCTFVELTNLVGALGLRRAVEELASYRLVCVDEFELDDPGDTVLISRLLGQLVEAGVRLAATSNTLPDKLGEGRFQASDFLREIQGLARALRRTPDRRRGLPAPWPAGRAGTAGRCRGRAHRRYGVRRQLRPLRRSAPAPGRAAPEPLRRIAGRRPDRRHRRRPRAHRRERRAAHRRTRGPDVRPRHPAAGQRRTAGPDVQPGDAEGWLPQEVSARVVAADRARERRDAAR